MTHILKAIVELNKHNNPQNKNEQLIYQNLKAKINHIYQNLADVNIIQH